MVHLISNQVPQLYYAHVPAGMHGIRCSLMKTM